jgi:heme oxygenase
MHQRTSTHDSPAAIDVLRSETAALHALLDATLQVGQIDRAGYRRLLERFFGFYEPFERCAPCYADPRWLDGVDRRKTNWLVEDLQALQLSGPQIANLPRCSAFPPIQTEAQQLGCMYVIEGSTLGGVHIARSVLPRLNITPDTGGHFFSSYGPAVGRNWRAVLQALESRLQSAADREAAAATARAMFESLASWLKA